MDQTGHLSIADTITPSSGPDDPLFDSVFSWLLTEALKDTDIENLFTKCCERLLGAGIPLARAHLSYGIVHPLYETTGLTWRRDSALRREDVPHREEMSEEFSRSTLYYMIRTGTPNLRRRLTGGEALLDFPILQDLVREGLTDYLGFLEGFGRGPLDGMVGSWSTSRPEGFSERHIRTLIRIQRALGLACKTMIREQVSGNVVTAYLGHNAGPRVLNGGIKRGYGETMRAVLWYSDLRQSTQLADSEPLADFIQALNDYFECSAGAALAAQGDISALVGDAVLAIFPVANETEKDVCGRALSAALDARRRLQAVNADRAATGKRPIEFGLGLHLGKVMFGNIGVPERVAFSVIGPSVNEVARLEGLTKSLGQPVLASQCFADHAPEGLVFLGTQTMRGLADPLEIYAPVKEEN